MVPRGRSPGDAAERRFFLERTPDSGSPSLAAADEAHALRVLRLRRGDALLGLDGAGAEWPLEVVRAAPRELELTVTGPVRREPAAGEPAAALPWIELAFAAPRAGRAEDLVDRAAQLGAAALAPIAAERSPRGAERTERWQRVARESCKQCGRLWMPEIRAIAPLAGVVRGTALVLDPDAERSLSEWLAARLAAAAAASARVETTFDRERPLVLIVGPEGGFAPAERELLAARGAVALCLSPHVLRIETAAEAALAIACEAFFSAIRRSSASAARRSWNRPG